MISQARLIDRLSRVIDSERILTDPARLDEVSWDALSDGRLHPLRRPSVAVPLCVVLPVNTAEVREVVLLANAEKVGIVPFGGGSGLMGGALSLQPGIVVDLRRMDGILEIDLEARAARVESGAVLESLENKLNEKGLILGHDPWTLPVATIGGAISTNSLGYRGGKYGSMGDQILGLEVVLPNGEILRTRAVTKASTGMSLKHLFIGSEGCFGIVTEATLKVFPLPEKRLLCGFRFASFEKGFAAIQKLFARGLRPGLVDFGDDPDKCPGGAVLYLAFEGPKEVAEAEERLSSGICSEDGAESLPLQEAQKFWRERHFIVYHFMHHRRQRREQSEDTVRRDWIHVALPASRVLEFRNAAIAIISRRGVQLQESGLWTQPELFSMRLAIRGGDGEQAQWVLQDTVEELLHLAQNMGGSMEYCHGVGLKLAPLMAEEHGYGFEVMRQLKRTLDPNGIMNPGKLGF